MNRLPLFTVLAVAGAATLLLEVTATRLLAPYFGNSIYVLSSVLAVILGFLSLGYWMGGILAERYPPHRVLFSTVAAGGIGGLLVSLLMTTIMPTLGFALPATWGPLVASILLFSAPSTCLGMVAPSAVRLHPLAASAPGRAAGEVLALSTVGSIGGSVLGGFFLVPVVGLRWTILGMALVLLLSGGLGLGKRRTPMEGALFLGTLLLTPPAVLVPWTWFLGSSLIHEESTPYQHVLILDRPDPERGGEITRYLLADHALMSAEDRETGEPTFTYAQEILAAIENLPRRERIAVLGGGAFTLPRVLHERYPEATIDAVDIDPELPAIAGTYFRLRPTARLRIHPSDGRRFLKSTDGTYDVVVLDMYQSLAIPPHTLTEEFFLLLATRLNPQGVIIMNIIGLPPDGGPSLPAAVAHTAAVAFPYQTLVALPSSEKLGNFLLAASREDHLVHAWSPRIGRRVPLPPDLLMTAPVFRDDLANTVLYETALAQALR